MQDVHTLLPVGSIIRDRYEVEALLGKGGFGAVYLVRDIRVKGNQFAIKEVIDPNKKDRMHFLFEGDVLKRLDHTALPRVYRAFEDEPQQRVYLLMDYIEGPNLERLRQRQPNKRFSLSDTLRLLAPIIDAVDYLHNQHPPVLHRDIKPANIIIPATEDGPVLVDFGIAKEYDLDATTTAVRRLSPNYSAPEQYTQGTNPRTDIYGMAATCYVMLTGTIPVDAFYRMTTMGNQGKDPLEPVHQLVPELPLSVSQAIERGMAISPDDRFPTMQAFWDALHPQQAHASLLPLPLSEPVTPLPETYPLQTLPNNSHVQTTPAVNVYKQHQEKRQRRRGLLPILFAIIALAALLSGILLGVGILSTRHPFVGSSSGTATTQRTASPTHTTHLATPSAASTATVPTQPSPPVRSRATPAPTYPLVRPAYSGTIHNSSANINGDMSLTGMQQSGANIGGTLILSNGLYANAHLTGTVASNNTLSFVVTPYTQYLPLLFQGQVNSNGSLSGTYCSERGNQCDYSGGGFGTWQVSPSSNGSYGS